MSALTYIRERRAAWAHGHYLRWHVQAALERGEMYSLLAAGQEQPFGFARGVILTMADFAARDLEIYEARANRWAWFRDLVRPGEKL